MTRFQFLFLATLFLFLPNAATAEEQDFSVGQWGVLGIDLPDGWTATVQGPEAASGVAISISPAREIPLVLLVTPLPVPGDPEQFSDDLELAVMRAAEPIREVAVEDELPIREIKGPTARFVYVSATDRTVEVPSADNFKFIDQGLGVVGGLMVTVTLLTNIANAPERAEALESLRSLRHLPPGPPWRTPTGTTRLAYPGKDWRLTLDLPGYEISVPQLGVEANVVKLEGSHPDSGMRFTIFLEEARPQWTATDYRKYYWKTIRKNMPVDREDVRRHEKGDMALLEFIIPAVEGLPLEHKNLNAFLVHDGVWVDVHLSIDSFEPADQALFTVVVDSIRFEE